MSFESQLHECQYCGSTEGPHVTMDVAQFSTNGARPSLTIFTCEPCMAKRQAEWKSYRERQREAWSRWSQVMLHGH